MSDGFIPWVKVYRNPWEDQGLKIKEFLEALDTAGHVAQFQLLSWMADGKIKDTDGSYVCVMLDPTQKSPSLPIEQRVMAAVLFGPRAVHHLLDEAASNADRYHRRGECASATYHSGVVSAGHGLGDDQNRRLASTIVRTTTFDPAVSSAVRRTRRVFMAPTIDPHAELCSEFPALRSVPHISDLPSTLST